MVQLVVLVGAGCFAPANKNTEETFFDGIFVDDVALGGLTMGQARAKVEKNTRRSWMGST